jgi:hypothetical protein
MPATRLRPRPYFRPDSRLDVVIEPGVVHVSGVVDRSTERCFSAALVRCDGDLCIQALDLSNVEFFSSVGVWCFIDRGWTHQPHVPIIASRVVRRVLTMCDMEFLLAPHGWRHVLDEDRQPIAASVA